jgi:hypothetical protein
MARLPDAQTVFGGLAPLNSKRPIASVDPRAIGKGIEDLGSGFEAVAKDARAVQQQADDLDLRKARADDLSRSIDLRSDFEHDPDYATAEQRFTDKRNEIRQQAGDSIRNPRMRELYDAATKDDIARDTAWIKDNVWKKQGNAQVSYVLDQGDKFTRQIGTVGDPETRSQIIQTYHGMVDGLVAKTYVTPEAGFRMKKAFADQYITNDALDLIEKDPAEAVRRLEQPEAGSIYSHLQPDDRLRLINRARSALTGEQFAIKDRISDDVTSILQSGKGVEGLSPEWVRSVYGARGDKVVAQWQAARDDATAIYKGAADMPSLTEQEILNRVQTYRPEGGSPDFARKQRIYETLQDKAGGILQQRRTDPAAGVANDPAVVAARTQYNPANPATFLAVSEARLAAQDQLGIPKELQSPITKDEALSLAAPLRTMLPGQERDVIVKMAKQMSAMFGEQADVAFMRVLSAHHLDATVARKAMPVLKQLIRGEEPGHKVARDVDQANEQAAADKAVNGDWRENLIPLYGFPIAVADQLGLFPRKPPEARPNPSNIPKDAIKFLLNHPDTADKFNEEYGKGQAEQILKSKL